MRRRDSIRAAGIGAIASSLAKPAIAQSTPTITWRLQSSYPASLNTLLGACKVFSKAVAEATDKNLNIQVFAAGKILPPPAVLDGVQNGTVEMGQTPSYFLYRQASSLRVRQQLALWAQHSPATRVLLSWRGQRMTLRDSRPALLFASGRPITASKQVLGAEVIQSRDIIE